MIQFKRAYVAASPDDGYRVLVDRLWPRGVTKERARLDVWLKELAPSAELRRWYSHDPAKWQEFIRRYHVELSGPEAQAALEDLAERSRQSMVTLVYASKVPDIHNAAALKAILESGSFKSLATG